eukprot:gene3640-4072_t
MASKKTPKRLPKASITIQGALPHPLPLPYPLVPLVFFTGAPLLRRYRLALLQRLPMFSVAMLLMAPRPPLTQCPDKPQAYPLAVFIVCLLLLQFLAMKVNEVLTPLLRRLRCHRPWDPDTTQPASRGAAAAGRSGTAVQAPTALSIAYVPPSYVAVAPIGSDQGFVQVCPLLMLLSQFKFPILGGLFTLWWALARFVAAAAYSTGDALSRAPGGMAFHVPPFMGLIGLTIVILFQQCACPKL